MVGICKFKRIYEKFRHRPKLVYFDPDVDGLIAGRIACKFLDNQGYSYNTYVNPKRAHGFMLPPEMYRGYLVIAVDFDIEPEILKILTDNDIVVLSLDHHDIQDELVHVVNEANDCEAIILNNQYPFEPEEDRYLSGAGVVFEVLRELDSSLDTDLNRALVGITLLSDARPIENNKARAYLKTTYGIDTEIDYVKYLIDSVLMKSYGFGRPKLDRNFIDYTLSPRINSMLRIGMEREAVSFILGNGMPSYDTLSTQKEILALMRDRCKILELENTKFISVCTRDFNDISWVDLTCYIGLLCSDIKGTGKSTLAFVIDDNGCVTRASFRGQYDELDYRQELENIGIEAKGHPCAFGIVNFKPKPDTWSTIDSIVARLNDGHSPSAKIIESRNIASTVTNLGFDIANNNCYVRDYNRTYIRYTGNDYTVTVDSEKFVQYLVNGRSVKCFNKSLNPSNGLILPILEKGYIQLYLREDIK